MGDARPELVLGTQKWSVTSATAGDPCAVISSPLHVQECRPARYAPQNGLGGANVILFDFWWHPAVEWGLEETSDRACSRA